MASHQTTISSPSVLVTGGSGFIATYVILQLLASDYNVRTTVRNASREASVRQVLQAGGATALDHLTFFVADLDNNAGWAEAAAGCTYVLHVASPFPLGVPKHEDELIIPAREGSLRVLRAAKAGGVKRVVLTSSFAAVGYGFPRSHKALFTENDWSILDGIVPVPAYQKSKTIAERAAWAYIDKEGGELELAVVNPVGVFGPVLGNDISTSIEVIRKLMDGSVPGCPQVYLGVVDVRDVADLHIRAMTDPKAKGQRFIAVADGQTKSFLDFANIIRKNRPDKAKKVPTRQFPNWLVHATAFFDPAVRQILPDLGLKMEVSNAKAKEVLGWKPRPVETSILDTADSLVALNLV